MPSEAAHGSYEVSLAFRLENGLTRLQRDNAREAHFDDSDSERRGGL